MNAPDETKKLSFPIDGSQFISFNYTQTLESLYGIQAERILYIHGCVSKNTDLILGHNKTKEDILLSWGTAKTEDDADLLSEAANELLILYKPAQSIITRNSPYWERLSDVSNIHVWGMSLSDVDVQYLSHIKSITNEYVEWEFSCFTPDDDRRVSTVIQQLELKNFKKCRLNDYE